MKKIIAILLVAFMLAVPFTALAHYDNDNLGTVPFTLTAPNIDAVKDSLYDAALVVPFTTPSEGSEGGMGGGGNAYILWDGTYMYAFLEMGIEGPLYNPEDYEDQWKDAPWGLANVEFALDYANEGGYRDFLKYRVTDRGWPDLWVAKDEVLYADDSASNFVVANSVSGLSWNMEFKINMVEAKPTLIAADAEYGSDLAVGKEIGIMIFMQEKAEDGAGVNYWSQPDGRQEPNGPSYYDYIVLGATEVNAPVENAGDAGEEAVDAGEEAVGGGEEADAEVPATTSAPVRPVAPNTGDATAMIFVVLAVALAGVIVYAKKAKHTI